MKKKKNKNLIHKIATHVSFEIVVVGKLYFWPVRFYQIDQFFFLPESVSEKQKSFPIHIDTHRQTE